MTTQQVVVPKYAHTPGLTRLAYSVDGRSLLTVGSNRLIRKFTVDSEDEPYSIEHHENDILGVATSRTHFATCSEDGTATLFSMRTNEMENMLVRQSLPIRDITFSPDGQWVAVAGDETTVKLINTTDITRIITLPAHRQGVKHVSFHPNGALLATSSIDGAIRVFSISSEEPELVKMIEGLTPSVESSQETSTKVAWHPDGRAFATQNKTRDIITVSRATWNIERSFASGHMGPINDFAWSPNGAYLATAGSDGKILVWDTQTQNIVEKHSYKNVLSVQWHPTQNSLSFTTNQGQMYTLPNIIPAKLDPPVGRSIYPSPLIRDPDAGEAVRLRQPTGESDASGLTKPYGQIKPGRDREVEFGSDIGEGNWIDDDDGAGYIPDLVPDNDSVDSPGWGRKRAIGPDFADDFASNKRRFVTVIKKMQHEAFQPGSTPWKNGRRYLALNSVGYIWTVEQDMHNTVTVSFFDRGVNREYHFTDHFLYDKACLTEEAALFANSGSDGQNSRIFFRQHGSLQDSWDLTFYDETVSSIALSATTVVVCSSRGYVRVFNLQGSPIRIYRQSTNAVVSCASWQDFVMIVRNQGDGSGGLIYSIENVKYDETFQKNDVVDIPFEGRLNSLFFSDDGDPCIYDSDGVLLVLMHWRSPLQAKWVPLLDTKAMGRNNPDESFWPLGVQESKFHCIILKGGEKCPYIPLPISSELDIRMPIYPDGPKLKEAATEGSNQNGQTDTMKLEEQYLRETVLLQLYKDAALAGSGGDDGLEDDQKDEISKRELGIDKTILQLLQIACRTGQHGKAYGLVGMIHKEQALQAANKIAQRYEMISLAEKVNRELEKRAGDFL
ncbi:WD40-repeat-containing domain protein [Lipomyces orientalis]|uniref:WD40-repeat-containing domain protein n=1 Tax=Lipomyces orientalis TaxID=1233043 RepID=A0ACC3TQZ5_9ASCO